MACGRKFTHPLHPPKHRKTTGVMIVEDIYDQIKGEDNKMTPVIRYTISNENQMKVQLLSFGATVLSVEAPDNRGNMTDIAFGLKNLDLYRSKSEYCIGSTVGRVANRIANAALTIRGTTFRLNANKPPHQVNGGEKGFNTYNWASHIDENRIVMSCHSPDKDEGHPGDVIVNAFFELSSDNELSIEYRAYTTKPTWVNLTSHIYFNLAGHLAGDTELFNHVFRINSEHISEVNRLSIPTGYQTNIFKTPFDLRMSRTLKDIFNENPAFYGFDHNYCLTKGEYQQDTFAARVVHPPTGRVLELYTNQPTVQFYTGNKLPFNPETYRGQKEKLDILTSKNGVGNYYKHGGFVLSPQFYPDAVNHQEKFSKFILEPGDIYYNTIRFKFMTQK